MHIKTIPYKEVRTLYIISVIFLDLFVIFLAIAFSWFILIATIFTGLLLTKKSGFQIDYDNNTYRRYTSFLGSKKGKWKPIHSNFEIVILKKKGKKSTTGTMGTGILKTSGYLYELYFMGSKHLQRIFIQMCEEESDIKVLANEISENLGLPVKKYNPQRI